LSLEDGRRLGQLDLLEILLRSRYRFLVPAISHRKFDDTVALDVLHSNHVEVFDGTQAHRSPMFRAGNILVSLKNINTILILDPRARSIEWIWGPSSLTLQHQPTLLSTGNLLIFNNGYQRSTVVELDPVAMRVVWEYKDDNFFSKTRGSVQRLPNGNTLITESDTGHVFEVTASGERVWEFANPTVDDEGKRAAVWRATRFAPSQIEFLPSAVRPGRGSRTAER
jgi:outer membrane protein assembly factor BamB